MATSSRDTAASTLADIYWRATWQAGGIPGQPDPDSPAEPGVPDQPIEPGEPTIPDQPPPAPVASF